MNYTVFIIGLVILAMGSLYLGLSSKKQKASGKDFFLAGRDIGFLSLVFTLLATQLGGGAVLGGAEQALHAGPFAICYSLGQALGFVVLSFGLGAGLRKLEVATTAEIFESRYQSPMLRRFAGLVSVVSLTGILIAMAVASRSFLKSIGVYNEAIVISFWFVLVFYTVVGGLQAVIKTDVFQAVVLLTLLVIALGVAFSNHPSIIERLMTDFSWDQAYSYSKPKFLGWLLMPFLFTFVEQDIAQRCFAGRSPKIVTLACIVAALLLIVSAMIPVCFGMMAGTLEGGSVGNPFIVAVMATTNPVISALTACAVLAAIISTADSILMAISSNLCQDFSTIIPSNNSRVAQIFTALIGVGALAMSYMSEGIFAILIQSYEISVCCLLVPVLGAVIDSKKKIATPQAAWGAVLLGIFGFVLFRFFKPPIPKELLTIGLSTIGYLLGYAFSINIQKEKLS